MSIFERIFGTAETTRALGETANTLAKVFTENKSRRMELDFAARTQAQAQLSSEFALAPVGRFNRFVNGLNRLPRPALALGTVSLFVYAMWDPSGFSTRMAGLSTVPEPLWWLLGAIVSFYFGARELHYQRVKIAAPQTETKPVKASSKPVSDNPALERWREIANR